MVQHTVVQHIVKTNLDILPLSDHLMKLQKKIYKEAEHHKNCVLMDGREKISKII